MANYQERFLKVIQFIESNLDTDLNVETLCDVAHLSKFHFHRQCSAVFGMPIMSLVRMLRLKKAAFQLAFRKEIKILTVAFNSGYESNEAFTRVFKKYFGMAPSKFRATPNWNHWQTHYDPVMRLRKNTMSNNDLFYVRVIELPEITTAAIEHRGSPNVLGATLAKFIEWRKVNRLPPSKSRTFNFIYDDPATTPADEYRFDIACSIERDMTDDEVGIITKKIPAGHYAMLKHKGSDDTLGEVIQFLFTDWIANSDFELRDFPLILERISFFPEVPEQEMMTHVYLPIKTKTSLISSNVPPIIKILIEALTDHAEKP